MSPSSFTPKLIPTPPLLSSSPTFSTHSKPSSRSSPKMAFISKAFSSEDQSVIPSILVAASSNQEAASLCSHPFSHHATPQNELNSSLVSAPPNHTLAPGDCTNQPPFVSFMSKNYSSSSTSTQFSDPFATNTTTISSSFSSTQASLPMNLQNSGKTDSNQSTALKSGWCSRKHCTYPQWLIFRLDSKENGFEAIQVHSIQILFHHFKIPSLLEIWTTSTLHDSSFSNSSSSDSSHLSVDSSSWLRLGHIVPSTNIASHFKARELKTIPVPFNATYVKFVLHKPHKNIFNFWNQVSILDVRFSNASSLSSSTSPPFLVSPLLFDFTPFHMSLAFLEEEKKQCVIQENYIRADEIKKLLQTLNELVQEAQKILDSKEKACLKEEYTLAEQHKQEFKTVLNSFFQLSLEHGFLIDPSTGHTTVTSKPTSTISSSSLSNANTPHLPFSQTKKLSQLNSKDSSFISNSSKLHEKMLPLYKDSSLTSSVSSLSSLSGPSSAADSISSTPNHLSSISLNPTPLPTSNTSPISSSTTPARSYYLSTSTSHSPPRLTSSLSATITDSATSPTSPSKLTPFFEAPSLGSPAVFPALTISEPPAFTSKSIPEDAVRSSMIQLTPDQCSDYAACIELFGPELVFYFLSKDFETKEKGLKGILTFLTDASHTLDSMLVIKASFLVIEKTLMDSRERIACWCFQVWTLVLNLKASHLFWQSTQTLFPQLLARVGDTNIRVSKAAHELAVTLLMKHPSTLVPLVLKSFPPSVQWRGIKARLHLICDTLDPLGLSVYDPMLVKALISEHLAHTHHEVRDMATQVLLRLAQWLDISSLEPCLDTIPQRFHRQALRMKLLGVQRRAISVLDNHSFTSSSSSSSSPSPVPPRSITPHTSVTQKRKLWPRWFSKSGGASLSTSTTTTAPSLRTSSTSPTRTHKISSSPSNASTLEDIACVFCNEVNPNFSVPSNLDVHYLKECPLLSECPYCNKIIELTQYKDHHIHECTAPTKPPITAISESHCPLCHISLQGKPIHSLLKHLLTGNGCPHSKRKPKHGVNYKSKLK